MEVVGCPAPEPEESALASPGGAEGEVGDPLPDVFVSVDMSASIELARVEDEAGRAVPDVAAGGGSEGSWRLLGDGDPCLGLLSGDYRNDGGVAGE